MGNENKCDYYPLNLLICTCEKKIKCRVAYLAGGSRNLWLPHAAIILSFQLFDFFFFIWRQWIYSHAVISWKKKLESKRLYNEIMFADKYSSHSLCDCVSVCINFNKKKVNSSSLWLSCRKETLIAWHENSDRKNVLKNWSKNPAKQTEKSKTNKQTTMCLRPTTFKHLRRARYMTIHIW